MTRKNRETIFKTRTKIIPGVKILVVYAPKNQEKGQLPKC